MNVERLIEESRPKLMGYALRHFTRSLDEAEDLVSVAVLRILKGFDNWEGASSFNTWATKILTNVFLDAKKKRRLATDSFEDLMVDPPSRLSVEEQVIETDRIIRAIEAVRKQFGEEKLRVALSGSLDSYEAAALEFDIPLGTVKSRINRVRLWLAQWESDAPRRSPPKVQVDFARAKVQVDFARAKECWEAGATFTELAGRFGGTKSLYVHRRTKEGWTRAIPACRRAAFDWAAIRTSHEQDGLTVAQLAKRYGASEGHIYIMRKRQGWKKPANLPEAA